MTPSLSENGQFLGVCWSSLPDTLQTDWLEKTDCWSHAGYLEKTEEGLAELCGPELFCPQCLSSLPLPFPFLDKRLMIPKLSGSLTVGPQG